MSNMEEVALAEEKMNSAKKALLASVESHGALERDWHRKLVARVNAAEMEFMLVVKELGK